MLEAGTAAAVLLAGALIGATGIGGVLVVPTLTQLAGQPLPEAIAASALAFALPGVAALRWLRRSGAWQPAWGVLLAAAVPAAGAGALLVHVVSLRWLLAALAALALFSGLRGLRAAVRDAKGDAPPLRMPALLALGLFVGFGSGLTGTGGPVLLVPLLLLWRQPLPVAVALGQAVQLPIALCAGALHAATGALPLHLALWLGVLLLVGSFAGRAVAQRLPLSFLHQAVSLLLVAVGAWFAWRAAA